MKKAFMCVVIAVCMLAANVFAYGASQKSPATTRELWVEAHSVTRFTLNDGTLVERFATAGQVVDRVTSPDRRYVLESIVTNDGMVIRVVANGQSVATYSSLFNSPYVTLTSDGEATILDRRSFLSGEFTESSWSEMHSSRDESSPSQRSMHEVTEQTTVNSVANNGGLMTLPPQYFDRLVATVLHRGHTAHVWEDYRNSFSSFRSIFVRVGETLAFVCSILGIPLFVAFQAWGPLFAWIGGTWAATTVFTAMSYGNIQRHWYRDVTVLQDPNNWSWYRAWRYYYVLGVININSQIIFDDGVRWGFFEHWDFSLADELGRTGVDNFLR